MMDTNTMFSLIIVCIGFIVIVAAIILIAKQKIITDKEGSVIEVDLPVIGKVKTNYPSIILLAAGLSLTFWGARPHIQGQAYEQWRITGAVAMDSTVQNKIRYEDLQLTFEPRQAGIDNDGNLEMEVFVPIKDGKRQFPSRISIYNDSISAINFSLDTTSRIGKKYPMTINDKTIDFTSPFVIKPRPKF